MSIEKVNPIKSEHLAEGVQPIIACLSNPENIFPDGEIGLKGCEPNPLGYEDINFKEDPDVLSRQGFKNGGHETYVISNVNSLDKVSEGFVNCTGLLMTGKDKETGENISFLSHAFPDEIVLPELREKFVSDIKEKIEEIKSRSVDGTIDAVVVGGNYIPLNKKDSLDLYKESIKMVAEQVVNILGFEPVIVTGPKMIKGNENVLYLNKHRRLFINRPTPETGSGFTNSYLLSNIDKQDWL